MTVSSYLSPASEATARRAPDSVSIPISQRAPIIAALPSRSVTHAKEAPGVGAYQCHSFTWMKPRPCILPFGSFLVPGGCHFSFHPIAFLPLSSTSLRLHLWGNPLSFWYRVTHSQSWPAQPSFFRATSVGSNPISAATRANITLCGTQVWEPCRKHMLCPVLTRAHSCVPRMLGILVLTRVLSIAGFRIPSICQCNEVIVPSFLIPTLHL